MKLAELDEKPSGWLQEDLEKGGKFVLFTYTISIIVMTFKRPSKIYYIASDEHAIKHGWPYLLISFLFGWWGIPWGLFYTIESIYNSFVGKDITQEVLADLASAHEQIEGQSEEDPDNRF